jgi:hypothetical protein
MTKKTEPIPDNLITAEEALRMIGKYPERKEGTNAEIMRRAVASTMHKYKRLWGLKSYKPPGSRGHLYDPVDILKRKRAMWHTK